MSHLKKQPTSISLPLYSKPFRGRHEPCFPRFGSQSPLGLLALGCLLMLSGGCAIVQIPSYRLEECASESYSSPPIMLPPAPSIPVPGWLARWKAEKNLPKPPAAPRFHPLPTRPMFQAKPEPEFTAGPPGEAGCYGTLPAAQDWSQAESVSSPIPSQAPTLASPM